MRIGVTLLFVAVVLLTQRFFTWEDGHALGGDDAKSYEVIALAAPAMPAEELAYHHAQRWVGPYAVGLVAKHLGVGVRSVFVLATGACLLGAILYLHTALARTGLQPRARAVCMAAFVFAYSVRFYLVAPGMLPDALFILGLSVVLCGLADGQFRMVLAGVLVAGLARQTVVLLIPGIACWLFFAEICARQPAATRAAEIAAVTALAAIAYAGTAMVAAPFAEPSENLRAICDLFVWATGPDFSATELAIFIAYAVFPLMIPAAMIVAGLIRAARAGARSPWSGALVGCLLLTATIASQPLLGGPEFTGNGNAMRLAALGLAPLVLALALLLKAVPLARSPRTAPLLVALLGAGSLHYNYTLIGPHTRTDFALIQLAVALLAAWLVFRQTESSRA